MTAAIAIISHINSSGMSGSPRSELYTEVGVGGGLHCGRRLEPCWSSNAFPNVEFPLKWNIFLDLHCAVLCCAMCSNHQKLCSRNKMGKDVGNHDVALAIWVCPNCSKYILRAAFKRADAALNFYNIPIPILCQQLKQNGNGMWDQSVNLNCP